MHPEVEGEEIGGGKWLMLVLIVGKSEVVENGHMETRIGKWAKEKDQMGMKYGIWYAEVDLS